MNEHWVLHLVSNTHWDREWYLGLHAFNHRLAKLMDRLLDLLAREPRFHSFLLDGQVLPVCDYLEVRPEQEPLVRRFVREGRLAIGPLYCQPSETLASGESLIRNFLLGLRRSAALGGHLPACYVIDQLGHISQLPQIARGFGFERVMLWRGVPADAPATFRWIGPDDSRVLLFFVNDGYGDATALPEEDAALTERVRASVELRRHRATTANLLLLNGVDHSYAQANLPAIVDRINRLFPAMRARQSSLADYLEAVEHSHAETGKAFEELRGEFTRPTDTYPDVHSFRTDLKARNARVERLLEQWAEPFAAIGSYLGLPFPRGELARAWEYVLQNQSHDTIGASSVDEVFTSSMSRFDWAEDIAREIASERLLAIANAAACSLPSPDRSSSQRRLPFAVFNPSSWERCEPVTVAIDVPADWGWTDVLLLDGAEEVPSEVLERRQTVGRTYHPLRGWPTFASVLRFTIRFAAPAVPPHGYRMLALAPADGRPPSTGAALPPDVIENELFRVHAHPDGSFDLEVKADGRRYRRLNLLEDGGEAGTGFKHVAPPRDRLVTSAGCPGNVSRECPSELQQTLRIDAALELPAALDPSRQGRAEETASCRYTTRITLANGVPRVDLETVFSNAARDHRLRARYPFGCPLEAVQVEQPFHVVTRPAVLGPEYRACAQARPMQSFVDLADGEGGLMVATDGLYEYEVLDDGLGTLAVTLLRATDRLDMGGHYDCDDERLPLGQELGDHRFRISLIPHSGTWRAAFRQAQAFRSPLVAVACRPREEEVLPDYVDETAGLDFAQSHAFVASHPADLVVTAIKRAESRETIIVRLLNTGERSIEGTLMVRLPGHRVSGAWHTDLKEDRLRELALGPVGGIGVEVAPWALATVEVALTPTPRERPA